MNQTEVHTPQRQMHNVVRGEFDQIPVTKEDERVIISSESENVDINLQVRPEPDQRMRVRSGELAAAGEGPKEGGAAGGAGEGGGAGRGIAPSYYSSDC